MFCLCTCSEHQNGHFLIRIMCFYYNTDINDIATSKRISFHSDRFIQKMDNIVSCPRQELSLTFLQSTNFFFYDLNNSDHEVCPRHFFSCLQVFFFSGIVARQLLSSLGFLLQKKIASFFCWISQKDDAKLHNEVIRSQSQTLMHFSLKKYCHQTWGVAYETTVCVLDEVHL